MKEGRFFPLAFYTYSVFYFIQSVFLFKLFVLTTVLASLAAFFVFLRKLTGSAVTPSGCLLLLPLVVQFRPGWDPILGFCAQYPFLTFLLFCSLTLFLKFLDSRDGRALAVAILLFLCCGLTFETFYPMCVLYTAVAFSRLRKGREAIVASWPFLAVTAGLTLTSLFLRAAAHPSPIYTPNYDPVRVIRAYTIQSFGALPFSYYWLGPHPLFSWQIRRWPGPVVLGLPLLVALALITVFMVRRRFSWDEAPAPRACTIDLLAVGALLFALPQASISLSPKYQAMPWGTAYLPVYISCLGLTVFLVTLLVRLYQSRHAFVLRKGTFLGLALVLWTWLFALNLLHNWFVATLENESHWYPRVLTEEALSGGLLANVQTGSILLVDGTYPWDNENEYSGNTKHPLTVYQLNGAGGLVSAFEAAGAVCKPIAGQQCDFSPESPVYTVQIRHLADGKGAVLLAHVSRSYQADNKINGLFADKVTAFFSFPEAIPDPKASISGRVLRPLEGAPSFFRADEHALAVTARDRGWELVSLRRSGIFDALSLHGDISAPVPSSIVAKQEADFELHTTGSELFHAGFDSEASGHSIKRPPVTFSDEMSIDVLVIPDEEQVPYADIFSNHAADYRGIAIEQRADKTNQYSIALGSGKEWMYTGDFSLQPARRNYISLQVSDQRTILYVNGNVVARTTLPAPIASTDRPVYLGNWIGGDRGFNGLIGEVLIASRTRSGNEVRINSLRLLGNGASQPGG